MRWLLPCFIIIFCSCEYFGLAIENENAQQADSVLQKIADTTQNDTVSKLQADTNNIQPLSRRQKVNIGNMHVQKHCSHCQYLARRTI